MISLLGCAMEQAKFNSTDSSLCTVGRTELGEDMLDMDFDRAHAHAQGVGDLTVGLSLGEQLQHLALTWGQPHKRQLRLTGCFADQTLE